MTKQHSRDEKPVRRRHRWVRATLGALISAAVLSTMPSASAMWVAAHHGGFVTPVGDDTLVASDAVASHLDSPNVSSVVAWQVAPGVSFRQWDQHDARGPIRAYLLTIDPATPGLAIDYASTESVRGSDTVRQMITREGAVAGVNGDFYDIGDTGAPLGLGVDRERGLLHARASGWNSAFLIKDGVASIADVPMRAGIVEQSLMEISHYNSPVVFDGEIGIYDRRFGLTAGHRVVDGQTEDVRQVVIRDHHVVCNRPTLTDGEKIRGLVLVGRGAGADALLALEVGQEAHLHRSLRGDPDVAISGNRMLLLHGVRRVVDDLEMHPRTAVGVDRDTGQVLMLVVDGRQSFSRGYTMVELANLMSDLGAEDALNLDGGGSSTLLARRPGGVVDVVNSPSDGQERRVANGLHVTYTPRTSVEAGLVTRPATTKRSER